MRRTRMTLLALCTVLLLAWGCAGESGGGDSDAEGTCEDFCDRGVECELLPSSEEDECRDDCEDVIDEAIDIDDDCEDAILDYVDCLIDQACEDLGSIEEEAPAACQDDFQDAVEECEGTILGNNDDDDDDIDDDDGGFGGGTFPCGDGNFIDNDLRCDGTCDCGGICLDEDETLCALLEGGPVPAGKAPEDDGLMSHEFFDYTPAR